MFQRLRIPRQKYPILTRRNGLCKRLRDRITLASSTPLTGVNHTLREHFRNCPNGAPFVNHPVEDQSGTFSETMFLARPLSPAVTLHPPAPSRMGQQASPACRAVSSSYPPVHKLASTGHALMNRCLKRTRNCPAWLWGIRRVLGIFGIVAAVVVALNAHSAVEMTGPGLLGRGHLGRTVAGGVRDRPSTGDARGSFPVASSLQLQRDVKHWPSRNKSLELGSLETSADTPRVSRIRIIQSGTRTLWSMLHT